MSDRREINLAKDLLPDEPLDVGEMEELAYHEPRGWLYPALAIGAAFLVLGGLFVFRSAVGGALGSVGSGIASGVRGIGDVIGEFGEWSRGFRDLADEELAGGTAVLTSSNGEDATSTLIVFGTDRAEAAFALITTDSDGQPTLVLIPQSVLAIVPGLGEFTLAEALEFEGPELVRLSLVNLLGIRIDGVATLAAGDLAAAVQEPLTVIVPSPLFVEVDGETVRVVRSGERPLDGDLLEVLLTTQGTGDQFEWLQRQEAVWDALFGAVVADGSLADQLLERSRGTSPSVAADLFRELASSADPLVIAPPVDRVALGAGLEALVLDTDVVSQFVSRVDDLVLRAGLRPRVEILNGTGEPGATRAVAAPLIDAGFRLIKSDNADRFDYVTTQVIAQGENAEAVAREIVGILGIGELLLELQAPSGVIDVSIIVGSDFEREG